MKGESPAVLLTGAMIVTHDSVETRSVAMVGRRVEQARADAFPVDLRDHFVFPGLVNAHDHLQLNCIPPLPHDAPFANSYDWIEAFAAHRQRTDVASSIAVPSELRHRHGGLKNVLAGVTTVAHHDPWDSSFDDPAFPVTVLPDFGWSHSLGLGGFSPRETPGYGPGVYDSFLTTPKSTPWFIHLAEGVDAGAAAELSRLEELGCLGANTVVVHGVGLTPRDVNRIIDYNAAVVWCPSSNLGMLGRTLDPGQLFEAGRLALATDSRLTGSRDLLDELRVALANCELTPQQLVRLVTSDAAEVLRMPCVGGLGIGQTSNCVILRAEADPYDTLMRTSRSTIRAVVHHGAPLIADPDFADWFDHCGIDAAHAALDGWPKLIDRRIAMPEIVSLEPGLEITE